MHVVIHVAKENVPIAKWFSFISIKSLVSIYNYINRKLGLGNFRISSLLFIERHKKIYH